jgi:ectoine hydroxylase-related dioxygenase (phytanoyl-CoA dioxygenase family)
VSVTFDESSIPGRHTIEYRVRDANKGNPVRRVEVLATPEEIRAFVRDGYLVRERLLPPDEVEKLRSALDQCVATDRYIQRSSSDTFGGTFLRHLADKHPAFFDLIDFPPVVSVARALFGPLVQARGFTACICFPDDPHQEVEWHFHQRLVSDPLPPLFAQPQTLEALLYLDDVDELNGPLGVMPGSHRWHDRDLPAGDVADKPGQVMLRLPAGSCVLVSGSTWHRALPTRPGGTQRRLIILGYGPAWQKPSIYGVRPSGGLIEHHLKDPDLPEEMRELLGVAGYM